MIYVFSVWKLDFVAFGARYCIDVFFSWVWGFAILDIGGCLLDKNSAELGCYCKCWKPSVRDTLIARFMGPTWGPSGPTGPRWARCWPHELCYLGMGQFHKVSCTFNLHGIHFSCHFLSNHQIATNVCTCCNSTVVMACAKFCSDHYIRIWMRAIQTSYHPLNGLLALIH